MDNSEFSIDILEGQYGGDVKTYYCHSEPKLVKKPIEGGKEGEEIVFMRFFPKNGPIHRVNRANYVPVVRVISVNLPE